jgi:uncharacterized membrane protein YdbT with pleckstrin-like domain
MSGFPASLLSADEDLVVDLRPHWIALIKPILQTILIVTGMIVTWLLTPFSLGWLYALTFVVAVALLTLFPSRPVIRWATSHFVVTTDRVIRRSGWIAKEAMEISLEKISDVRFQQGMLERLIGAGTLTIESAGRSGQEVLEDVQNPERVQKLIFEMKERNNARSAVGRPPVDIASWGPASVADELTKLYQLMERGVLSDEEFRAVKARLLGRV